MLVAQRLRPLRVEVGRRSLHGIRQRRERERRGGEQLDLAAAILAQFLPVVADADQSRIGHDRGRTIARLVVELAADHNDQVRLLQCAPTHRADHGGMRTGYEIAAFLRVEIHGAGPVEHLHQLDAGTQRAASGQDQRPARFADDPRRAMHIGGVGQNAPRRLRVDVLAQHDQRRHGLAQYVGRYLDIDGPRWIAIARRRRIRLVEVAQNIVGDAQRARRPRHRPHDLHVRDALQRPEVVLRSRRAAADQQHRHAFELRVGHRGHAIGDAGPRRHHGDTHAARQYRVRMRHVHGGAFVAHVDDSHAAYPELVPDRLDVAALQAEDTVDAARDQEIDDQFSDGFRPGWGHRGLLGGGGGADAPATDGAGARRHRARAGRICRREMVTVSRSAEGRQSSAGQGTEPLLTGESL